MCGKMSGMVLGVSVRADQLDFHCGARLPLTDESGRAWWPTVCPQVWTGGLEPSKKHQKGCSKYPRPFQLVTAPVSFSFPICSAAHSQWMLVFAETPKDKEGHHSLTTTDFGPRESGGYGDFPCSWALLIILKNTSWSTHCSPNNPPTYEDPLCQEFLTHLPISACQHPVSSQILQRLCARGSSYSSIPLLPHI